MAVKLSVIAAPLCEGSLAAKRVFALGTCHHSRRSNATFFEVYGVSPRRLHFTRFGFKIELSVGFGAHVFSVPRFFSSGSDFGHLDFKSLLFYNTFRAHLSKKHCKKQLKVKIVYSFCSF